MIKQKALRKRQQGDPMQRLRIIGLAVLGAVAVGVIIFAIVLAAQPARTISAAELQSLASGKALGPADAKVVIKEFADFQCPYCLQFHNRVEAQVIDDYVKTGKVRYEYHHFIIIDAHTGGTESQRAAEASECANVQGKFWAYHDTLFAHQGAEGGGAFADNYLSGFAQTLGLDMSAFNSCLSSAQYKQAVRNDVIQAVSLGVQGTPTLFINGTAAANPLDFATLQAEIERALAQSS